MAKVGGARIGAGRPKGSVNQRTVDMLADAATAGISPIEYMLRILRNDEADPKERAWAAEKAAPYLHPRPAPVPRPIRIELPDTSTVDGIRAGLQSIARSIANGEIAPVDGQGLIAVVEAQRKAIETDDILARLAKLEQLLERRA